MRTAVPRGPTSHMSLHCTVTASDLVTVDAASIRVLGRLRQRLCGLCRAQGQGGRMSPPRAATPVPVTY
jgi:hypothetical protein